MSRENNFFNVENDFEKLDKKYDRSKLDKFKIPVKYFFEKLEITNRGKKS